MRQFGRESWRVVATATASLAAAACTIHHRPDNSHPAFQVDVGTFPSRQAANGGDLMWIRKSKKDPYYECIALRDDFWNSFVQIGHAGGTLWVAHLMDEDDPNFNAYDTEHDIDVDEFHDWIQDQALFVTAEMYDYREINHWETQGESNPPGLFETGIYAVREPDAPDNDSRPVAWVWRPASPNDREVWLHYRENENSDPRYQRPSNALTDVRFPVEWSGNDDSTWRIDEDSTHYDLAIHNFKQYVISAYAALTPSIVVSEADLTSHDYRISDSYSAALRAKASGKRSR
jgi:hypothetical protein